MPLIDAECPSCKESIKVDDGKESVFCMYCGSKIATKDVLPPADGKTVENVLKRAMEGDASAQYEMGTFYRTGTGVKQSYADAMEWYLRAAEQGDPFAMYNIGQMYSCGFGVKQNCAIAASWYAKANENGIGDRTKNKR